MSDNVYDVEVSVSDGVLTETQSINVTIENEDENVSDFQTISANLEHLADEIGDLKESGTATQEQLDELEASFNAMDMTSVIDDAAADTALNVTRSAKFIADLFAQAKTDLLGGAAEAYNTLGKLANALIGLSGRVDQLEIDVDMLKSKYDAQGNLKLEFIPASLREGIKFAGFFDPSTDTLAAPSDENESWMYKVHNVAAPSSVTPISITLNPGTANERIVDALPGDTLMSDGVQWIKMGRSDVITKVNGKTGEVVLVAADIQYTASNESGLTSGTVKATFDAIGETLAGFAARFASIGEAADLVSLSSLKARIAAAAGDGVTTAAA